MFKSYIFITYYYDVFNPKIYLYKSNVSSSHPLFINPDSFREKYFDINAHDIMTTDKI